MNRLGSLLCLIGLAGCGGGTDITIAPTAPVTGVATFEGKPLEGYKVHFSDLTNHTATGMVDPEGRFALGTYAVADGAPIGAHKVWLVYQPDVQIEAGKEDQVVIPPAKVKLPDKYSRAETAGITIEVPEEGLADCKIELP